MRLSDLEKYEKITIQCHDNPDADALASGYGLYCYFKSKGRDVRLVYSGRNRIQKSNICLMLEKLHIPVEYIPVGYGETVQVEGLLLTVDCQYGSGNVTGLEAEEIAVIDHHQVDHEPPAQSVIQSNLGSCATLVWKLLNDEGFDIDGEPYLGTALYYGLYTDTNQFSELYNPLDMDMREDVEVDKSLIILFRNSNISLPELEMTGISLIKCIYNGDYEFAIVNSKAQDPNILGLISDFLLQVDVIKTCVVFNVNEAGFKFSVRSCVKEVNASELAAYLADDMGSGGGHYEKAGGFIPVKKYEEKYPTQHTESYFGNRMREYFDSHELLYAEEYVADIGNMQVYARQRVPLGYVKLDEIMSVGQDVTIRTLGGDIQVRVEEEMYAIIGTHGSVKAIGKSEFKYNYEPVTDDHNVYDYIEMPDYIPVIKTGKKSGDVQLTDYAKGCVPMAGEIVYAKPLEKATKVFTLHDKSSYQTGKPGDYLVVMGDNHRDIHVVEKDIFQKNYEAVLDR